MITVWNIPHNSVEISFITIFITDRAHLYIASTILAIIAFLVCCREAQRYAENQIKEVIISYYELNKGN